VRDRFFFGVASSTKAAPFFSQIGCRIYRPPLAEESGTTREGERGAKEDVLTQIDCIFTGGAL
jgi:hypothetical protein